MHVAHGIKDVVPMPGGCVVALGNFDGFHKGHQVVVGEAGRLASMLALPLVVVVTEPHPNRFFQPDAPAFRLTPEAVRTQLLQHFGVDQLLVLPFDAALAAMPAQDFVLDILKGTLNGVHVAVGYDYRFGSKRGGGTAVLAQMGHIEDFGLSIIAPVTSEQLDAGSTASETIFSSTAIRKALQAGDVDTANTLLGHTWRMSGIVQHGDARGRTIGFPTANVALGDLIEPMLGVYAVLAHIDGHSHPIGGVANIGKRPTFDKRDVLLEVHLFDFKEDIYDRAIDIDVVQMIRPERKFDGLDALKTQIAADTETARQIIQSWSPSVLPTLSDYLNAHPDFPK